MPINRKNSMGTNTTRPMEEARENSCRKAVPVAGGEMSFTSNPTAASRTAQARSCVQTRLQLAFSLPWVYVAADGLINALMYCWGNKGSASLSGGTASGGFARVV